MWYIFPQIEGLGVSATARLFSIRSVSEAEHYLAHPILGPRLIACAEAAVRVNGVPAIEIFGSPDDLKLRSSATLFASLFPPGSVFHQLIDKYFDGERDERTIHLMSGRP
jgi:uncharacterized protein (DUF1810 family)